MNLPQTLGAVLRQQARMLPEKVALRDSGIDIRYAELDARANRVANGLIAMGIGAGDRISYLGKNHPAYFELLFGAARMGAVMAPINWRLADAEMHWILTDADSRLIVAGSEYIDRIRPMTRALRDTPALLEIEQQYPAWRDTQDDKELPLSIDPHQVAIQLYTSGTTGTPKGAMLTHRNLLIYRTLPTHEQPEWNRFTHDDVSLIVMPMFHIGGTGFGIQTLAAGATGLIARDFDADQVLRSIADDGLSKIFVVPSALQILLRHPRARSTDYSRVRTILYGASPIALDLLREAMDVFQCGFVQMYGMTETSGTICALTPDDHDPEGNSRMRSAGRPLADVELRILDATDNALPAGISGEVAVRAPVVMQGYWKLPEATAAALSDDGWLRTGDVGYLDEAGYLFILDRVKDMILSGGENIYPAEVEQALNAHPDIEDVVVIGVPSNKWGEEVKAIVVRTAGATLDQNMIINWARERIAGYKLPKSIDFVDALPRGPTGKVLRRALRAPYWENRERQVH